MHTRGGRAFFVGAVFALVFSECIICVVHYCRVLWVVLYQVEFEVRELVRVFCCVRRVRYVFYKSAFPPVRGLHAAVGARSYFRLCHRSTCFCLMSLEGVVGDTSAVTDDSPYMAYGLKALGYRKVIFFCYTRRAV